MPALLNDKILGNENTRPPFGWECIQMFVGSVFDSNNHALHSPEWISTISLKMLGIKLEKCNLPVTNFSEKMRDLVILPTVSRLLTKPCDIAKEYNELMNNSQKILIY